MDQQQVDSEKRRQRIRRAAFLCIHTLSNVACFRAGCDVEEFHLHRHFYGRAHNNFLDTSVMKWCMLFADENSKHHAFKVVSDKDRYTRELLAQLKMTWEELEAYGKMLRTVRDKFIAHLDDVQRAPMPMLDAVVESAAFTLLYLHRHEGKNADLVDVPPPGQVYYDRAYEDARYAYTGKPKVIRTGGRKTAFDA